MFSVLDDPCEDCCGGYTYEFTVTTDHFVFKRFLSWSAQVALASPRCSSGRQLVAVVLLTVLCPLFSPVVAGVGGRRSEIKSGSGQSRFQDLLLLSLSVF